MKQKLSSLSLAVVAGFFMSASTAFALDYPHSDQNDLDCLSCHVFTIPPPTTPSDPPDNIDDTEANNICWGCHDGAYAPYVKTHSSLNTSDRYGDADGDGVAGWSMECITCHNPHRQAQVRDWGEESYLFSGDSTGVTSETLELSGATWAQDEWVGHLVQPNVTVSDRYYPILANSEDTLTVQGPIDTTQAGAGDTFAIIYAKLIRSEIETPNSGHLDVKLFQRTGQNSFADGDATFDGVCEVCHTQTTHFRNDGSGSDQLHTNVDGAGAYCIDCHNHANGFAHGGGGGSGCETCHGHDAGYEYAPGEYSEGRGSSHSHSTHTEDDADDLKGPHIDCDGCHNVDSFPSFKSGVDLDGDGKYSLAETDVCDPCHSPGGSYEGVDDPIIGAKANWHEGIYSEQVIQEGKEKWCASCHDEEPAVIYSIYAPKVIGDESASTPYGMGYGFFKTGHGLASSEDYPASGGSVAGAGLGCTACHDVLMKHIDGNARTYEYTATLGSDGDYQHGYRLQSIGGEIPMNIPRLGNSVSASDFRLCFSCHDSTPYVVQSDFSSNFRNDASGPLNAHYYHLSISQGKKSFISDWGSHAYDSRATCVTCHNVHGSPQFSMVRDGALVGQEPGIQVAYYNDTVSYLCAGRDPYPPTPADVLLPDSTGTVWNAHSARGICDGCHGSCGFDSRYMRAPVYDSGARAFPKSR